MFVYRVILYFVPKVNANNFFDYQYFLMQLFANSSERSTHSLFFVRFTIVQLTGFVLFKEIRGPSFLGVNLFK